jgi:hypothetical protein
MSAPEPRIDETVRAARPAPGMPTRIRRAFRALAPEHRHAAIAAVALWVTMFLPWYSKTVAELRAKGAIVVYNVSAYGAFSFVEAAVLLVSVAVLVLLFARAERRAFHLPFGDGAVIALGGTWVALLVLYRMIDKPGTSGNATLTTTIGVEWGIFMALFAAIALAYSGLRIRTAHRPEPTLTEDPTIKWTLIERQRARRERADAQAGAETAERRRRREADRK